MAVCERFSPMYHGGFWSPLYQLKPLAAFPRSAGAGSHSLVRASCGHLFLTFWFSDVTLVAWNRQMPQFRALLSQRTSALLLTANSDWHKLRVQKFSSVICMGPSSVLILPLTTSHAPFMGPCHSLSKTLFSSELAKSNGWVSTNSLSYLCSLQSVLTSLITLSYVWSVGQISSPLYRISEKWYDHSQGHKTSKWQTGAWTGSSTSLFCVPSPCSRPPPSFRTLAIPAAHVTVWA